MKRLKKNQRASPWQYSAIISGVFVFLFVPLISSHTEGTFIKTIFSLGSLAEDVPWWPLLVQNPVFPHLVPPRLHRDCWVRHGLTNSPIQGQKENTTARPSFVLMGNNRYHYGFKFKDNEGETWPYHYYSFINSWEGNCLYSSNTQMTFPFTRAFSTFTEFWVISKEAKPQLLLGVELCPSQILCWSRNFQYLRVWPHLEGLPWWSRG